MVGKFKFGRFVHKQVGTGEANISFVLKPGAQHAESSSSVFVFWITSMLRVTAQTLFLFYLVVDVINNPVDLASGKLTRCSGSETSDPVT